MGVSQLPRESLGFRRLATRWFRAGGPGVVVRCFERDQPIYMEHDPAATVYCIDSGNVKIAVDTPDGRECPLGLRVSGELLGELCACGMGSRRESAFALDQVTVRAASTRAFLDFVDSEGLSGLLLEYLAEAIIAQQRAIAVLLLEPSERRLAYTLLELSERHGGGDQIPLRLSQAQLGELIGTTRSRVGQFLKNFRELGLIRDFDGGGVRINRERLDAFCR
jgi:CRP-like cAMP-binding protein